MIIATDFDGTLTIGEMGKATGKYLTERGQGAAYRRFLYTQLPLYGLAKMGIVSSRVFKKRWAIGMPKLFKGFTLEQVHELFEWVVEHELWPRRRQDVIDELTQYQQQGHTIVIVSGAYQTMLEAFARRMGVRAEGTPLEISNGHATGKLAKPLNVGEHKVRRLREILNGQTLAMAYGDTLDDLPMLDMSEIPVAVHPNPALAKVAQQRGWRIMGSQTR
jgi:HAD superfamily hydrolase (TIGR01490 family)